MIKYPSTFRQFGQYHETINPGLHICTNISTVQKDKLTRDKTTFHKLIERTVNKAEEGFNQTAD